LSKVYIKDSLEKFIPNNISDKDNDTYLLSEVTNNLQLKKIYFGIPVENKFDTKKGILINIILAMLAWIFLIIFIIFPHEYEPERNYIYFLLFLLFYIISFLDQLENIPEIDLLEQYVKFIKLDEFQSFLTNIISSRVYTYKGDIKIRHLYSIDISGNFIIPDNFTSYYFNFYDSIYLYYKKGID